MSSEIARLSSTHNRLLVRSCEALIGICNGLIADGELNDREIIFLSTWLSENQTISTIWPGEIVFSRVREVLADGIVTAEERTYLVSTLEQLVGGSFAENGAMPSGPNTLPMNTDIQVSIVDRGFCFTGQFLYGTRTVCERVTMSRGGTVHSNIFKKVHFLVIGDMASRDWKHSSHGTKIDLAVRLKSEGLPIEIVSEANWVRGLG